MHGVFRPLLRRDFEDLPVDPVLQRDEHGIVSGGQTAYGFHVRHQGSIDLVASVPAKEKGLHQDEAAAALLFR